VVELQREAVQRGRVLDAGGIALANVVVQAHAVETDYSNLHDPAPNEKSGAARTDENGAFVIHGLHAGRQYRLVVISTDGAVTNGTRIVTAGAAAVDIVVADDFIIQKDRVGLVLLGMPRRTLQESTYQQNWMQPQFMDQHLNVVEISLPGDQQASSTRPRLASMVVHLDGNRRDSGTVSTIDVRDPRFRTAEGLGTASTLGDIRALHPGLAISHEVIYESFDGMKPGDALAEVHHPYTMIDGVKFLLRPANYLQYRPADGLPDNTPVQMVRVSVSP
jgi:hypothetical protein